MREREANQEPGFGAPQLGNKLVGKEEEELSRGTEGRNI